MYFITSADKLFSNDSIIGSYTGTQLLLGGTKCNHVMSNIWDHTLYFLLPCWVITSSVETQIMKPNHLLAIVFDNKQVQYDVTIWYLTYCYTFHHIVNVQNSTDNNKAVSKL